MKLYAVEYKTEDDRDAIDDHSTFEIFKTYDEAKAFATGEDRNALYMFTADFDDESIYTESNGQLNYEDHAGLFTNDIIIEKYV